MRPLVALVLVFAFGAAARPADPPAPLDPRGLPGPLVIAGGGKLPADVREAFFALAGKAKAKIVVIPTASIDADDDKKGENFTKQWEDLKPASVTILHTRDKKKADDADFVKPLAEATGVWFSGGDQNRLTATYRGTLVEKELKKLHARGGVIGGTSAGAAVMTDLMIAGGKAPGGGGGEPAGGSPNQTAETADGFGFLPGFVVDQHFVARKRQARLEGVITANPARVGLGLDEGTAIVVRGRVARVIGDSTLSVCASKPGGKGVSTEEFKAGQLIDLVQYQRAVANRIAKEPFPPKKPAEPVVAKGSLVIVGGGGAGPDIWKKFIELAGGPDSTIVVVTSAMEDPLAPVSVEERILKQNGAKNVSALHTRDRKEADDPKFSEILTKASGVWFSGGRQWRFVDSYEGTLTYKRFHEVLGRGGVIGGSSAGASIQSEYMPRGHPLGNLTMAAEGYERGFAFLPGCAVDQHFFARSRTADMTGLMKEYPQYLGIGIDEGTAIVVTGSVAEVMGKSKVAFYDTRKKPDGEMDYEEVFPNGKYDLKERKKVSK